MPFPGLVRAPAPARRLDEVAALLGTTLVPPAGRSLADVEGRRVMGVCLDSRAIQDFDLYAALPGARTHGARFASAAAALGARAVLTDPEGLALAAASGLPVLSVPDPRAVLGDLAAWVYGEPATRLQMFGVTGTNGKTTTTFLLDGALRRGGLRCGLIGTVETRIGDERVSSVRTTPEAPDVQALLARMVEAGVDACSMEVSSHALRLGRVDGVRFDVAGFTNLSQDHLDFHPTMEDYYAAKADLFTPARARRAVICVDDEWGRRLAAQAGPGGRTGLDLGEEGIPVTTVSTNGTAADWRVEQARAVDGGTDFVLAGPDGRRLDARCPLPGDFNVANTVLALVMLVSAGIDARRAAGWLAEADPVPGRMEPVRGAGRPGEPLAVVDYAHTPDAVAAALRTLRGSSSGPLVVVLGAGGDRDAAKRSRMGRAAATEADLVIVTDDNPRSEQPAAIRAAVLAGTREVAGAQVLEIGDRRAAIAEGVRRAWGGTLLVAGKGHERGQEIDGTVHAFDDREVLAAALGLARADPRCGGPAPDTSGDTPGRALVQDDPPDPGQEAP